MYKNEVIIHMADVFIKINGAAMPCPSSFTWGLQDISASESGRTDDTIMHKNRVGQKRKLEIFKYRFKHMARMENDKIVRRPKLHSMEI